MLVRAKISFAGAFSMYSGEVKECNDSVVLQDLMKAGYVEEVAEKATKGGKNEGKRSTNK
ncbi:MAG: hypothetical protein K0R92_398 [Lachnospiraceae bacterium]|jgi:hypothetical protein|nr:hypothetical protein [Lachnospiraceae bacterium]